MGTRGEFIHRFQASPSTVGVCLANVRLIYSPPSHDGWWVVRVGAVKEWSPGGRTTGMRMDELRDRLGTRHEVGLENGFRILRMWKGGE